MNKFFNTLMVISLVLILIQAQNDYETDNFLETQQLPLVIKNQPVSQVAIKSNRVTFKCDFEASINTNDATGSRIQSTLTHTIDYNLIKISWLHDSQLVMAASSNDETHATLNTQYIIDRNSLVILSYDPLKHSGQYRCLINNTIFSPPLVILSEPANLSMAIIDEFEQVEAETVLDMSEGNVAIISCKLPFSNPPAVPIFYFNDVILQTESNKDTRFKVFPSGNLQIANVKHKDSGVYKCNARNPVTNEIRESPKKTLVKVYEPFGTKLPDIIYNPLDTNRVKVGGNLTLECVANGAPVPLVSWEKFGGILPEKRSQQIFGSLVLTNLQLEDKGTYVCRAENGPGQATFKTAMVDVFESPIITSNSLTAYSAKQGETVQLKCPIRSRPRADIQWFYQGRLVISNQNQRIQTVADKSTLTIRNFQTGTSAGIYQCYAQNEYGSKQVNLLLIPSESVPVAKTTNFPDTPKRPIIIMGPQNTTIYEGQSVVLLCATSESGTTQINWLQNDLIIEPTLMRRFEINQLLGNLRIVSIQKSDAGIYKCIASNEFGMSTAEAIVQVKSSGSSGELKKEDSQIKLLPQASRPIIQQIGADKILLKWQMSAEEQSNVAYFKVDYKTNKQQQQIPGIQPNTWLTIDEQIDNKKREYILTDLSKYDTYRFRITTFFLNGELNHGHQSSRFKLETTWSDLTLTTTTTQTTTLINNKNFKLSQIQVQITQIWAITASSLGLKWNVFLLQQNEKNNMNLILSKINGFYIYYRKIDDQVDVTSAVPLYNYTRLNLPVSPQQSIETHIIASLEPESQYEIKMTCYNLKGDLCAFSNTVTGLTLSVPPPEIISTVNSTIKPNSNADQVVLLKTKQNEILFMILGIVLGILTLLLVIFVVMCLMRHIQHKRLLAQLQNTSQKLTSSSCPTLIYEDSLRQTSGANQHRINLHQALNNYSNKILDLNQNSGAGSICGNDSNSTNSQSMSTTTSSMTTPPALNSAQTNSDIINNSNASAAQILSHVLLLNGNTVSSTTVGNPPPPIPIAPPPSIFGQTNSNMSNSTLNRMNINLNPLNTYLESTSSLGLSNNNNNTRFYPNNSALSPVKINNHNKQQQQQNQENFYHTLTTLGNLPTSAGTINDFNNEAAMYADYNNATLNIRTQILLKQQQQQQQHIQLMNTLLKQQQHFNNMTTLEKNNKSAKSPSSSSSMRRNNLLNSSKKSKKSLKKHNSSGSNNTNMNIDEQQQQLQQPKNYYLLPNVPTQQQPNNIYNDVNLLSLEAAFNQNNLTLFNSNNLNGLGNFYLLNNLNPVPQIHPVYNSSNFSPNHQNLLQQQQQSIISPSKNNVNNNNTDSAMLKNLFESKNPNEISSNNNNNNNKESSIYESSDMDNNLNEQEPMLGQNNHYSSSSLLTKNKQYPEKVNDLDEQRQLI